MARSQTRLRGIQAQDDQREQVADAGLRNQTAQPVRPMQAPGSAMARSAMNLRRRGLQRVEQNQLEQGQAARSLNQQKFNQQLAQDAWNRTQAETRLDMSKQQIGFGQDLATKRYGMAERGQKFSHGRQQAEYNLRKKGQKFQQGQQTGRYGMEQERHTQSMGERKAAAARGQTQYDQQQEEYGKGAQLRDMQRQSAMKQYTDYLSGETNKSGQRLDAQGVPVGRAGSTRSRGRSRSAAGTPARTPAAKLVDKYAQDMIANGYNETDLYDEKGNPTRQFHAFRDNLEDLEERFPNSPPQELAIAAAKGAGIRDKRTTLTEAYEQLKQENIAEMGYDQPKWYRNESDTFHSNVAKMKQLQEELGALAPEQEQQQQPQVGFGAQGQQGQEPAPMGFQGDPNAPQVAGPQVGFGQQQQQQAPAPMGFQADPNAPGAPQQVGFAQRNQEEKAPAGFEGDPKAPRKKAESLGARNKRAQRKERPLPPGAEKLNAKDAASKETNKRPGRVMYKGKQAYYVPTDAETGPKEINSDELQALIDKQAAETGPKTVGGEELQTLIDDQNIETTKGKIRTLKETAKSRGKKADAPAKPDSLKADLKAMKQTPAEAKPPAAASKPILTAAKKKASGETTVKAFEKKMEQADADEATKANVAKAEAAAAKRIVGGVDTKTGKRVTPAQRQRKLEAYSDRVRSGKMPKKDLIDLYFGLADVDEENLSNVDLDKFADLQGKKGQHIVDRVYPAVLLDFAKSQGLRKGGLIDALESGNPKAANIKQYMKNKGLSQGDFFKWYLTQIQGGRKGGHLSKEVKSRLDKELEPMMMSEELGTFVNK